MSILHVHSAHLSVRINFSERTLRSPRSKKASEAISEFSRRTRLLAGGESSSDADWRDYPSECRELAHE